MDSTEAEPQPRVSAVAAVLRAGDGGTELLLIRRADREGDVWSGHLAFPGGKAEESDADVVATAVRETWEELGLRLDAPGVARFLYDLPVLKPRIARAPLLNVHPFAWMLEDGDVELVPNEEVATFRWVSLDYLRDANNVVDHRIVDPAGIEHTFPGVQIDDNVLWGITHRIVESLFDVLDADVGA